MNSIRLHINRLGLIRNSQVDIAPLLLFSGESGLGKSYVAILCHYFFHVWLNTKRLSSFFLDKGIDFSNHDIPDQGIALSIKKTDLEKWLALDAISYLRYMLGFEGLKADISITLPQSVPDKLDFMYEREIIGVDSAEEIYNKLSVLGVRFRFKDLGLDDENPYALILRYGMIQDIFGDYRGLATSYVLPPSRGSYLSESISPNTGLWVSFIEGMKDLERAREIPDNVSQSLLELFQTVLDGEVRRESDKYVFITHGEEIPISAAAASVREAGALQLMVTKRDISKLALLIEEPEAHLHPLKQRMMADIIGTMALGNSYMQITTHSDYFLRRLNDLIRLHILKNRMSDEEFRKLCDEHQFNPSLTLDPSKLAAYYLERGVDGFVTIRLQDSKHGVPFDTFESINGKFMSDSTMLYDLVNDD